MIQIADLDWVYTYASKILIACGRSISLLLTPPIMQRLSLRRWRDEQEQHMRRANKPALSESEVRDFVDRYMPAYKAYLHGLYADPTTQRHVAHLQQIPRLIFEIDSARLPVQSPRQVNSE